MSHSQIPQSQPGPVTVVSDHRPAYDGRMRELVPIVVVNAILLVLTVGIYRFWAKTRLRRYFLSRISLLDDRLVYTGTGKELFYGFLVVLAFFIPFGVAFQLLSVWAQGLGMAWFAVANIAYVFVLYYLLHFALFRANRYRLSRITWRGIRAGQTGSGLRYANLAILYSFLVALSFGLAYPLMRNRLQAYKINHAAFGSERLTYNGKVGPLIRRWLVPWGIFMGVALAGAIWAASQNEAWRLPENGPDPTDLLEADAYIPGIAFTLAVVLSTLAMFRYRAAEVRHFTQHTRFGELSFASALRGFDVFLPFLLIAVILAAFLAPGAMLTLWAEEGDETTVGMIVFIVFLFIVLAGPLQTLVVQHMLLRAFCKTLTINGRISSESLLQSQIDKPARGEGLADALDVDAF